MAFWNYREALSLADKLRRSYYELLRDDIDQFRPRATSHTVGVLHGAGLVREGFELNGR